MADDAIETVQPSSPILGWMPGLSYPDVRRRVQLLDEFDSPHRDDIAVLALSVPAA